MRLRCVGDVGWSRPPFPSVLRRPPLELCILRRPPPEAWFVFLTAAPKDNTLGAVAESDGLAQASMHDWLKHGRHRPSRAEGVSLLDDLLAPHLALTHYLLTRDCGHSQCRRTIQDIVRNHSMTAAVPVIGNPCLVLWISHSRVPNMFEERESWLEGEERRSTSLYQLGNCCMAVLCKIKHQISTNVENGRVG